MTFLVILIERHLELKRYDPQMWKKEDDRGTERGLGLHLHLAFKTLKMPAT